MEGNNEQSTQENEKMQTEDTTTDNQADTPEYVLKGKDIGPAIITPISQGWPDDNLSLRKLKEGLEKRKYKWAYTDERYEETEIYNHIINNEIDLDNCWRTTEDDNFRKLKSGQHQKRTPPPSNQVKERHNSR